MRVIDVFLASIKHILAEPNRDTKKHSQPFKVEDFLIFPAEEDEDKPSATNNGKARGKEMSWQEQLVYTKQFLHPFFTSRANLPENQKVS